jgi:hypothetical protein
MRAPQKTLGTLAIVFGAIVAVWMPLMTTWAAYLTGHPSARVLSPEQALRHGASQAVIDAQRGYEHVNAAMMIVMSLALVVVGVALVKNAAWARRAAQAWSGLALAFLAAQCLAYFAYFRGAWAQAHDVYYQSRGLPSPNAFSLQARAASIVVINLFLAAFPSALLAILRRRWPAG